MKNKFAGAALAAGLLLAPGTLLAAATGTLLYGGVGGHTEVPTANIGAVVIVNQNDATFTVVGNPIPGTRLSGVAFDASGALYASTEGTSPGPPISSTLIRVDPDTGSLLATIGPITAGPGGPVISIADLAVQPGTDLLYGVRSPTTLTGGAGKLYVIDKTTAVATFIGNTPDRRASIAFTPGGTLYEAAFVPGPKTLFTLDPATGAPLSSVPTAEFYGALAARPTDSALFAGNGDPSDIVTLDPATGAATGVGSTNPTLIGGLTFRTCSIAITGASANPAVLWPPNHKLVAVAIGYTATGSCSAVAPVTCSLSVASNEGDASDFSVVDAHDVLLRATRSGGGSGRTYTVTIACTDTAGSSATADVTVSVPHDQGH